MYVLSIDPGKTTGVVLCKIKDKDKEGRWDFDVVWAEEVFWEDRIDELQEIFETVVSEYQPLVTIIMETFRLYKHAANSQVNSNFPAVQVIGAVQVLANMYGMADLVVNQPPSARQRTKVLPQHKAIVRGSAHKQDAYRHARYWIVRNAKDLDQGDQK